jgi:hypothetical protein
VSREEHFREANQNLLDAMDADQDFDNLMQSLVRALGVEFKPQTEQLCPKLHTIWVGHGITMLIPEECS